MKISTLLLYKSKRMNVPLDIFQGRSNALQRGLGDAAPRRPVVRDRPRRFHVGLIDTSEIFVDDGDASQLGGPGVRRSRAAHLAVDGEHRTRVAQRRVTLGRSRGDECRRRRRRVLIRRHLVLRQDRLRSRPTHFHDEKGTEKEPRVINSICFRWIWMREGER